VCPWGALIRSPCKSARIRYADEFVHPTGGLNGELVDLDQARGAVAAQPFV
jgi:hypothetical protein